MKKLLNEPTDEQRKELKEEMINFQKEIPKLQKIKKIEIKNKIIILIIMLGQTSL